MVRKSVFVFGATGAVGARLCPILVDDEWQVIGSTRQEGKVSSLRAQGVEPIVLDVFDTNAVEKALLQFAPDVVIIQLTDLPIGLPADAMEQASLRNAKIWGE
ncbi:MAG: NAD(P)H-binding protein [Cyanobacteria bacterium REEB67]|nr:NAD(P)H-binding protein [Cyanobacteria bacterium REEB67]